VKKTTIALGALFAVGLLIVGLHVAFDLHPLLTKTSLATDLVMAGVVAVYGTGSRNPTSLVAIQGIYAAAEMRARVSQIAVTNGDSIASVYRFGEIPADCIIDPNSVLWTAALTGVTDFDVGLRYPNGGAVILADCIVNGQTLASATSVTLAAATGSGIATPANQIKRAWELAGLTSNPGGNLEVYGTANAAATATGVANLILKYFKGA
jgi:hypothetical protein